MRWGLTSNEVISAIASPFPEHSGKVLIDMTCNTVRVTKSNYLADGDAGFEPGEALVWDVG